MSEVRQYTEITVLIDGVAFLQRTYGANAITLPKGMRPEDCIQTFRTSTPLPTQKPCSYCRTLHTLTRCPSCGAPRTA